ncbi:MAG: phosphoribosyltransferase family protein [Chitinophagaceae bacterium]
MSGNLGELILTQEIIDWKIRRMAYEVYERNMDEKELILAGIYDRGMVVAEHVASVLKDIAPFKLQIINLNLDRLNPVEVKVSEEINFTGKVIIVIDDVANSGRTLLYSMKPLLNYLPKSVQTAVLIDRMHKAFPVIINYVGHSLSTTLRENILVDIRNNEIGGVYLS